MVGGATDVWWGQTGYRKGRRAVIKEEVVSAGKYSGLGSRWGCACGQCHDWEGRMVSGWCIIPMTTGSRARCSEPSIHAPPPLTNFVESANKRLHVLGAPVS